MRLVVLIAWAFFVTIASSAHARELRVSHHFDEGIDTRDRAVRVFANEVQLRSPNLKVSVHANLALNLDRDRQLAALQDGSLEMAVYPLVYATKNAPEFALGLLPGLIPSPAAADALKGTDVHHKLQEIANANGVRILTWWWLRGGFLSRKAVVGGPDTVSGLKVRSGDSNFGSLMRAAGASPVELQSSQLYEALRAGKVDVVLTSYENMLSRRLYDHASFATFGSNSLWTYFSPLLISNKVWSSLGSDEREAIEAAAEVSNDYFASSQWDVEKRALAAFRKVGAKINQLTYDEYLGWLALAQRTAWTQYAQSSPSSRDLLFNSILTQLATFASRDELADLFDPAGR